MTFISNMLARWLGPKVFKKQVASFVRTLFKLAAGGAITIGLSPEIAAEIQAIADPASTLVAGIVVALVTQWLSAKDKVRAVEEVDITP